LAILGPEIDTLSHAIP